MNLLDICVICALGIGVVKGFLRGAVKEVFGLLAIILAVWVSYNFHDDIASLLLPYIGAQNTEWAAYIIAFLAVYITIVLIGRILTSTLKALALGPINRLAGAFICSGKFALIIFIGLVFLTLICQAIYQPIPALVQSSKTYQIILDLEWTNLVKDSFDSRQNLTL